MDKAHRHANHIAKLKATNAELLEAVEGVAFALTIPPVRACSNEPWAIRVRKVLTKIYKATGD